jgi:S-DNA-T family DNA segregation ATPase FtsK/SpoIIIE
MLNHLVSNAKRMGKRKTTEQKSKWSAFKRDLSDERIPKILGLLCFLLAVFLFVAFVSYLFTWQKDQDEVLSGSWRILFNRESFVDNWLGKIGALTSHLFIYSGFGLASFAFIFFLIQLGRKFFDPWSVNIFRLLQHTGVLLWLGAPTLHLTLGVWISFPIGGAVGISIVMSIQAMVGWVGTVLIFIFLIAGVGYWYGLTSLNKPSFSGFSGLFKLNFLSSKKDSDNSDHEEKDKATSKKKPEKEVDVVRNDPAADSSDPFDFEIPPFDDDFEIHTHSDVFSEELQKGNSIVLEGQTELELTQPIQGPGIRPEKQEPEVEIVRNESVVQNYIEDVQMEEDEPLDLEPYDPTKDLSRYAFPDVKLLQSYPDNAVEIDRAELEANKNQITSTLANYKIEITKIRATIGPTVTLYEIVPAPGVRISKIKNLEDDIALSLAALGIRIIAPIPGKGTIGIEVPNKKKQIVSLREVFQSEKFRHANMELPIALGKTISNEVFVADLAKMPHLLIAGATGQGKSVGINAILMSILYKKHPSQVKLVLIDPKKVELSIYAKLEHHFLAFLPDEDEPIITETKKVIHTLSSLCVEMDNRYDLLKKANARNISEYNAKFIARRLNPEKGHKYLPYIVLVVDEFADLIMTAGKEVEMPIARLAQLARAIGIHLIIATQRPSVNIITGVIKANFPARLAFKVTSGVDSKTILDRNGADQLIGRGDMLLSIGGDMVRLQCAFVDTPEVEDTINFIGGQSGYAIPFFLPEYVGPDDNGEGSGAYSAAELDDYFDDAARLVVQNQQGSTSMIQRRLKLGYNRAGRIMDQLEAFGIVGANEGSKAREVLIHDEQELTRHLSQIRAQRG